MVFAFLGFAAQRGGAFEDGEHVHDVFARRSGKVSLAASPKNRSGSKQESYTALSLDVFTLALPRSLGI
jgi:hypothetical protein